MRYFSFALRCRILDNFIPGKRFVSYKARINLVSALSEIMNNLEPIEGTGQSGAQKKNINCTQFAVSVLANGSTCANSICVHSDLSSYLFNCGEGVQRLAMEHGLKIAKVKSVFVTYHSWASIGGIMGLCLTLQQQRAKQLVIYGPPFIKEMVLGLGLFVSLRHVSLIFVTEQPKYKYDDSILKVQFVPIYPNSSKIINGTTSDTTAVKSPQPVGETDSDTDSPPRKRRWIVESKPLTNAEELYSLCYICESPEYGLHLDVNKCNALGVPCGPLLGVLKSKNDVKLPNGKIVHWEDVFKGTRKSETFIVVDCPTEAHLESFVNEPEFARFQGSPEQPASLIIHFTEPEIMKSEKYTEWMSRFPPTTKHMKVNSSNRVIDHIYSYRLQEKLHFLDPAIFPKLSEENLPEVKEELSGKYDPHLRVMATVNDIKPKKGSLMENNMINSEVFLKPGFNELENINGIDVISAFSTLRWTIFPSAKQNFSHFLYLDRKSCLDEILDIDAIREGKETLKKLKESWEASDECKALPEYPKILFLGTGSSMPFALRNTSAILMELEGGHLAMFDCGEGTYGQMLRFFGKERLEDILKRLRLIYVSHQHADHHLGLINLLDARYKVLSRYKKEEYMSDSDPAGIIHLALFLPPSVRDWVHSSNKFKTLLYDARIIVTASAVKSHNTLKKYTNVLGITNFKTTMVPHSYDSYAVSFVTPSGYRVTYSGDTLPSDSLVELGKDSDLLIHEATFEDGLEAMAKQKNHCTISQALDIGKRMRARFVMLTHFSQRYSHLPQLSPNLPENMGIAFDNMLVTPKILPFLTRLMKYYKIIFADKVVALNSKSMKRMLRNEKKSNEMKI